MCACYYVEQSIILISPPLLTRTLTKESTHLSMSSVIVLAELLIIRWQCLLRRGSMAGGECGCTACLFTGANQQRERKIPSRQRDKCPGSPWINLFIILDGGWEDREDRLDDCSCKDLLTGKKKEKHRSSCVRGDDWRQPTQSRGPPRRMEPPE